MLVPKAIDNLLTLMATPPFATESVMDSVVYGCVCMKLHVAQSKVHSGLSSRIRLVLS